MKPQFNSDQVINLIQSVGKIGGSILATYGVQVQNLWAGWVGSAITAISLWFSHHSAATGPTTTASAPGAVDNTGKLPPVILCVLLACTIGLVAGCASPGESQKIHAGIMANGFGYKDVMTSTNGVKTTNSFKLTIPVNLTNSIPLIEGAFE